MDNSLPASTSALRTERERLDLLDVALFGRAALLANVSAAGREFGLSAAGASARIANLARLLGARLPHRTNRRISLTQDRVGFITLPPCVILSDQRDWGIITPPGRVNVRVNGRFVTDNGEVIRDALLDGFGIALKSTWDVAGHLRSGQLVTVLDSYPLAETVAIWAVYPSRAFVPPKTVAFIEFLTAHFGDPPYLDVEPS